MQDILSELGEGKPAKRRHELHAIVPARVHAVVAPPAPKAAPKPMAPVVDRGIGAYLNAMAHISAIENSRPNRVFSLVGDDPTAPVAAGGVVAAKITLPTDSFLVYWVCNDLDVNNFLLTSLKVASFDVVGGSPANLAAFTAQVNRIDRPGPLTGRMFEGGTTIEANFRNISGAPAPFRGMAVWMISTDCTNKRGKPAPSVLSFASMASGFRNLFMRKGLVR